MVSAFLLVNCEKEYKDTYIKKNIISDKNKPLNLDIFKKTFQKFLFSNTKTTYKR